MAAFGAATSGLLFVGEFGSSFSDACSFFARDVGLSDPLPCFSTIGSWAGLLDALSPFLKLLFVNGVTEAETTRVAFLALPALQYVKIKHRINQCATDFLLF